MIRLEFARLLEPMASALPSQASLTIGCKREIVAAGTDRRLTAEVDFGGAKIFSRFEAAIENPGCRRGQGRGFELQTRAADGSWKPVYNGKLFGLIGGKQIAPTTSAIPLIVDAPAITQFDVF